MNEIRVLQLGSGDVSKEIALPAYITYTYLENLTEAPRESYDLVFLGKVPDKKEIELLYLCTKTYCMYMIDKTEKQGELDLFFRRKKGKYIRKEEIGQFLQKEARFFYPKPYGEKYHLNALSVNRDFQGSICWNGNVNVSLTGDFGKEFHQVAFFRNYIPIEEGQILDFWLEYKKSPNVSLTMEVAKCVSGTVDFIERTWSFDEEKLKDSVRIENVTRRGLLSVSISAKGMGSLQIIALHDRFSRGNHGFFLPGGERFVSSKREEFFCYFDPGDLKPPLNVYFSGYKTLEGFEGYNIMKRMGVPFLLVAEARLEGGNFYMGSEEYEQMVVNVIQSKITELGFSPKEVVFSGLSMGTYGALYYGCDIHPHAVILGKPLASIGDVAVNERLLRPGGFPTSLDVLLYQCGTATEEKALELNDRFWSKFEATDFSDTKFIVSYMIEDDYDATAYEEILSHLSSEGTQIYGKGLHGRHNDNTNGIVQWFLNQYVQVLVNDFNRKLEEK